MWAAASLILLGIIEHTPGNAIQILLSDPGHATSPALAFLRNLHLLELQQHAADDAAVRLAKVFGTSTLAVIPPVPFPQLADAHSWTEVDFTRDGGGADVIPIVAVGRELLGDGRLDEVGPHGEFELVGVFEVFGVCGYEGLGGHVADAYPSRFFGHGLMLLGEEDRGGVYCGLGGVGK